jgi:hypothetical protein
LLRYSRCVAGLSLNAAHLWHRVIDMVTTITDMVILLLTESPQVSPLWRQALYCRHSGVTLLLIEVSPLWRQALLFG